PFEISDIYPSGSNGDLQVTIIEADGRRRSFTQAYASLPIMLPSGAFRYSVSGGQVDNYDGAEQAPNFLGAAWNYGVNDAITGFGGVQWAEDYRAVNLGAGVNTPLGAVSADLTHSASQVHDQQRQGHSLRVRYANTLEVTATALAGAG
ncbi:fimbria/pilus outer membrane usher protein, partial [Pandoraea sputorum]|uniref:fimbria/pilus outer membrane usher protein n=1 Tax=Pandoraea sputorum TaxID=93222 RepID=UPI003558753C